MKTYELKDGRKVKAVPDIPEPLDTSCQKCVFFDESSCGEIMEENSLPNCSRNDIHFEKVEDEK